MEYVNSAGEKVCRDLILNAYTSTYCIQPYFWIKLVRACWYTDLGISYIWCAVIFVCFAFEMLRKGKE